MNLSIKREIHDTLNLLLLKTCLLYTSDAADE